MATSRTRTQKATVSVAAAGTNQSGATVLQRVPTTLIVTVSSSARGVKLPGSMAAGEEVRLINEAAFNVKVYPDTGDKIGAAATNANTTIAANKSSMFVKGTGNRWNVQAGA